MALATVHGNTFHYKGGNFLRQRLLMSILSGKTVRITNIRELDEEPGLREYEVSLIRLFDKISNGTVITINHTATSVYFQPGLLLGDTIEHDCSTQRSIAYYLEPLVILGLFCKQPLHAKLRGVTCNNIDPSVDLVKESYLSVVRRFIVDDEDLKLEISKRGMLPLGGGEVIFKCPIVRQLRPINLEDSGLVKRVRGTAFALRVSPSIANRMVEKAKGVMLNFLPDVYINTDQRKGAQSGKSPGFGIHLMAETTKGTFYSAEQVCNVVSLGEEHSTPEDVGTACAQRLVQEICWGGVVDSTSQPVAIICMALSQSDVSRLVTGPLTETAIGVLRLLREFFGVTFVLDWFGSEDQKSETGARKVLLTCVGRGYTNISKRTV